MLNELFAIEQTICIKMDVTLNNLQNRYAIKPNQPTNIDFSRLINFV